MTRRPGAPRRVRARALAVALLAASLAGCGLKNNPRPPEDVLPKPIADLRADDDPKGVRLTWSRPRETADGEGLDDLGRFVVERAEENGEFVRLTIVVVDDLQRFRKEKRFRYVDETTTVGTAYRYRVVSSTTDGYVSPPSNIATGRHEAATEENHAPLPATQR